MKDRTGAAIETTLIERLKQQNVTILEKWMAIDVIMRKRGHPEKGVRGIWCLDAEGIVHTVCCRVLVLATGGNGQPGGKPRTQALRQATGWRWPTERGKAKHLGLSSSTPQLAIQGKRPFLITEALRGHGAV